jgi:hypothetical protein
MINMSKIKIDNVKIVAKNGGSIKNYDNIEITNSSMDFEQNGIDISMDESVAIIQKLADYGYKKQISDLIIKLKKSEPAEREEIVKKSFLTKVLKGIRNIKPLIDILFKYNEMNT